jgi:hypothetical protein
MAAKDAIKEAKARLAELEKERDAIIAGKTNHTPLTRKHRLSTLGQRITSLGHKIAKAEAAK